MFSTGVLDRRSVPCPGKKNQLCVVLSLSRYYLMADVALHFFHEGLFRNLNQVFLDRHGANIEYAKQGVLHHSRKGGRPYSADDNLHHYLPESTRDAAWPVNPQNPIEMALSHHSSPQSSSQRAIRTPSTRYSALWAKGEANRLLSSSRKYTARWAKDEIYRLLSATRDHLKTVVRQVDFDFPSLDELQKENPELKFAHEELLGKVLSTSLARKIAGHTAKVPNFVHYFVRLAIASGLFAFHRIVSFGLIIGGLYIIAKRLGLIGTPPRRRRYISDEEARDYARTLHEAGPEEVRTLARTVLLDNGVDIDELHRQIRNEETEQAEQ